MNPKRTQQLAWVAIVFVVVVSLDQLAKAWINDTIPKNSVHFMGHDRDFFWLTHERNPGLVGGLFRGNAVIRYAAPLLATMVLVYLFLHLDRRSRLQSLAYGLVAGGAVGNLIDRLRFGEVVDFLQVHFWFVPFDFPWKYYPAFNIADSCICTGVALLIFCWRKAPVEPAESANAAGSV